jgi:very-short-patch-repair endonuclease
VIDDSIGFQALTADQCRQVRQWLIDVVPGDGSSIGNKTLRDKLEQFAELRDFSISEENYWRIRDELISEGLLSKGGGRGGSVYRYDDTWSASSESSGDADETERDDLDTPASDIPESLSKLRNRLLDLSARNRLLNFSHARSKRFVRIIDELPDQIFEALLSESSMRFSAVPDPTERLLLDNGYLRLDEKTGAVIEIKKQPSADVWAQVLGMATSHELPLPLEDAQANKHADDAIQSLYYPAELEARLQTLHAQSRSALEETGANILYLALGFLEWDESVAGKNSSRLAPLMLLPVRLEKGKLNPQTATFEYHLYYTGEDILTNLSLCEKLKCDFGIALPRITEEVMPEEYFSRVTETVLKAKPEWKVHRYGSLGLFEFGKLMMYLDLDPSRWKDQDLVKHSLVQRLTGMIGEPSGQIGGSSSGFCAEHAIDDISDIHLQFPLIDDADSSQHSALVDVIRGDDLVIEGPPGTGKSQTITNMIAAALAQGKKVLFVAEKRAALEVVKTRLTRAGLGDFCLELHSHKSQKSSVIDSIGKRIQNRGVYRSPKQLADLIANYERLKHQLNNHVQQLHTEFASTGLSLHQVLMQATRLRESLSVNPADFHPQTSTQIDKTSLFEQAEFYAHIYRKTAQEAAKTGSLDTHPWFGSTKTRLSGSERSALIDHLKQAIVALAALEQKRVHLCGQLKAAELANFAPEQLHELAQLMPHLPLPKGDEDWDLLARLDTESCEALKTWLLGMDSLLDEQAALARSLRQDVIASDAELQAIKSACAAIRLHNANEHLSLNALLEAINQARELLEVAPRVQMLIHLLAEAGAVKGLKADLVGIEQLLSLLKLLKAMPLELATLRHKRFEDEALDTLLAKLELELAELHGSREQVARTFSLDRLPDHVRLEDLNRVLADSSLLRWFKSEWRAAKVEVMQMLRPGLKFKNAVSALPEAAQQQKQYFELIRNTVYAEKLGEHFLGLDTQLLSLQRLRAWYKDLRSACGRGFGAKVWIADFLLMHDSATLGRIIDDAVDLQGYLEEVLTHREVLEQVLPFDGHELRSTDLLGPNGLYVRLTQEVGEALQRLLPVISEEQPSLGRVLTLIKAVETWQAKSSALQNDQVFSTCLADEDIPRLENLAAARGRLSAWRHTVAFVQPLLALRIRNTLIAQLTVCTQKEAEVLICSWKAQGVELAHAVNAWQSGLAAFFLSAQVVPEQWWQSAAELDFEPMARRLGWAAEHADLLEHWFEYRRLRGHLTELGFETVVLAIENQNLQSERCADACLLGLLDSWALQILEQDPALGQFSGKEQEAIQARFAQVDEQLKSLQREQIAAKIDQNKVPEGNNSGKVKERTQLSLLRHEAGKKTRHEPIRSLMNRAAEALQGLKPCFMMSPMAVAQYLPAGHVKFDLIVMDEASQLRPQEALGSIARGKQVVIVGDPKQLPPTNFFSRQGGEEEGEDSDVSLAEDSESILEAAMPLFKLRRLRWHYRSRHESLIAFSNKAFYDSNLVVYPSPHRESSEFGVKFVRVPRGRFVEQRNIEEAEVVVLAIEHHMLHRPDESLGVVSMNAKQADQIERMLEQRAKQNVLLQEALDRNQSVDEPLFIKNLENVQGDERDVIYISSTYGPMEAGGKVPQRFGPINGTAGWRRLNVLFTRSKKRMQIFASFGATDVLVTGTSSRGVQALRDFMQFAESGRMPHIRESERAPDSDFEVAVIDALARHGYECEPQVGVAGFFIDLAVRDPGQPGRYLMGIECDGAAYHSAKSARDRDRLRQSVLEGLGWRIRRIWSVDWFRNARIPLEPILQELAKLRSEPQMQQESTAYEAEELVIQEVAEQQTEHAARITLPGDHNLREKLQWLDQQLIRPALPNTAESQRLLRPAMLEALIEFMPEDRAEFQTLIPGYLRSGTLPAEGKFIDDVLTLISEHD